jgi:hypothetical protein
MKVKIVIDEKGKVTIENEDVVGSSCADVSDKLAAVIGQKQEQELKQEYYEVPLPDFAEIHEE